MNARSRGKVLFIFLLPKKKKKTLNIPLHTNPSNFTPNFKPHTISPLGYIEIEETFQTPHKLLT